MAPHQKNIYNPLASFMKQILFMFVAVMVCSCKSQPDQVLVFTKTSGFRHDSIETGVKTLEELGQQNEFVVTHTENSEAFSLENLKNFQLVIFLNTTQDVLDETQQAHFESYINNGGSFMGIHAAADTEYDWAWYGKLVGAYFESHPDQAQAEVVNEDFKHPACSHLPERWKHFDEWYNYKNISSNIKVVLSVDETSYEGGTNGDFHPIAWYQEFDGGKVFYTGLGHTKEAYTDSNFRHHLLGGIQYCLEK